MNKKVIVTKNETGHVIATDEIDLTAVNYDPAEKEWFDIAWENAVQDGLVNEDDRDKYTIIFA